LWVGVVSAVGVGRAPSSSTCPHSKASSSALATPCLSLVNSPPATAPSLTDSPRDAIPRLPAVRPAVRPSACLSSSPARLHPYHHHPTHQHQQPTDRPTNQPSTAQTLRLPARTTTRTTSPSWKPSGSWTCCACSTCRATSTRWWRTSTCARTPSTSNATCANAGE
jgi:hypothetical protein